VITFFNALVSADKGYTLGLLFSGLCRGRLDCWVADVSIAMLLSSSELVNKHNPENNNPIDNGRENLHSIKGYTPLNLSDNIISDIVKPNIPDTIANIKQKSLHGRYFKELEQPEVNIQASHAWLKKSNIHSETEGFIFAIQDRVINTRNYKKTHMRFTIDN
jgi:hypothetical protein